MKLTAEVVAQFQPQPMNEIDILGPEPRRVRPKVYEYRRPAGIDDFQRERVAGLGQSFPCASDAPRKLFGIHARGHAAHQARGFERCGRLDHRVEWFYTGPATNDIDPLSLLDALQLTGNR